MSEDLLPQYIDIQRLAKHSSRLAGQLALNNMVRLSKLLIENKGTVVLDLHFGIDEQGFRYVKGQITAKLALICQRCLGPMEYNVNVTIALSPVETDITAGNLPKSYEPVLEKGGRISLSDMIEDELLLSLPIIAKHDYACAN